MNKNLKFEKLLNEFNKGIKAGGQSKLAEKLGVSAQTVSSWINGKTIPSQENIVQLAKIFNKEKDTIQKIFAVNSVVGDNNNINSKELELKDKEIELKNKEIELLKRELELWKMGYTMNAVKKIKEGKK